MICEEDGRPIEFGKLLAALYRLSSLIKMRRRVVRERERRKGSERKGWENGTRPSSRENRRF